MQRSNQKSQEILPLASPASRDSTAMIRHSREDLEIGLQVVAKRHDRSDVAAAVAVVGSRPDGYHVLRGKVVFVALVDQLMRSSDEGERIDVVELDVSQC